MKSRVQNMIVSFTMRNVMADFEYPKIVREYVWDTYIEKTKYVRLLTKETA
jgi:hypothetical protein